MCSSTDTFKTGPVSRDPGHQAAQVKPLSKDRTLSTAEQKTPGGNCQHRQRCASGRSKRFQGLSSRRRHRSNNPRVDSTEEVVYREAIYQQVLYSRTRRQDAGREYWVAKIWFCQPQGPSTSRAAKHATAYPLIETSDRPTSHSGNQSTNQPASQPTDQATDQPNQPTNQPNIFFLSKPEKMVLLILETSRRKKNIIADAAHLLKKRLTYSRAS